MSEPDKPKSDDVSPEHLSWLVDSRARNQKTSLRLFMLMERHNDRLKDKEYAQITHTLVSASFSLWRAAFLADRRGKRGSVFNDAKQFLAKMLVDNAITYPQDRATREWTFNYYIDNAMADLDFLGKRWGTVSAIMDGDDVPPLLAKPKRRWNRCQQALIEAVNRLEAELPATMESIGTIGALTS